jgi:hypothetical protein
MQLSDGHDRGAQINGACAAPPSSTARCLASVGPPPIISSSLPLFPCFRVSSIHLSSLVRVVLPSSHHPLVPCHVFRSFIRQPLTRRQVHYIPSSSLHVPPRRHHSYHTPCPPRWPPCPSLKLFSCSRWQHEKSSPSREAELAEPFSIPRRNY